MKRYMHFEVETDPTFPQQDIEGMARAGEIPMRGTTFEVYVNTNDPGKIPQFHVRNKADWSAFHTCVRIAEAEYFHHGNKLDTFNAKEKKALDDFMCDYPKKKLFNEDGSRLNNWEYICMLWDMNNSDAEISEGISQPDYTQLP